MLSKVESVIINKGQCVLDKEAEIVPRDQRRGREVDAEARAGYAEPNRDNTEARGPASSTQMASGVTQRVPEAAQCLKELTQRVLGLTQVSRRLTQVSRRLTQWPEGPALSFSCAREGFVGQVF